LTTIVVLTVNPGNSVTNLFEDRLLLTRAPPTTDHASPKQHVTGDPQEVRLWIAHFAQVPRAKQSQIGLLRQVFDVDRRSHAPAEKSKQTPIPALLPPDVHGRVRHAVIIPRFKLRAPSTVEPKVEPWDPPATTIFVLPVLNLLI
jgi:hypothetical protein